MGNSEKRNRIVRKLIDRDGVHCHYCGVQLVWSDGLSYQENGLSIDHITPQTEGGETELDNLVLACRKCNTRKGTKHYQEFRLALETDAFIKFLMGDES